MTMLVSLSRAKAHLNMDHSADDAMIEQLVHAASGAVLNYLKTAATLSYLDSSGDTEIDSTGEPQGVPYVVQQATLLMVGWLYRYREPTQEGGLEHGYLPPAVMSLLYQLRDPALA